MLYNTTIILYPTERTNKYIRSKTAETFSVFSHHMASLPLGPQQHQHHLHNPPPPDHPQFQHHDPVGGAAAAALKLASQSLRSDMNSSDKVKKEGKTQNLTYRVGTSTSIRPWIVFIFHCHL